MDDDLRYLRKWLNEENIAPIDRVALATVLHEITNLRDRIAGYEGLIRMNDHKINQLRAELEAVKLERDMWKETDIRDAKRIDELREQLTACQKDAERYRWLRKALVSSDEEQDRALAGISDSIPQYDECMNMEETAQLVDAAIDAAMKGST